MKKFFLGSTVVIGLCALAMTARAEVKVIEAESTYVMGDNDSRIDARRIATQEARRKALELAGTYVESLSEVRNYRLTKDEVKAYTAGVVETDVVAEEMRGSAQHPEIYIKARCRIDTDVLVRQMDRYRENEDLKEQIQTSARENEELRQERDALVKQLAAEEDKSKIEATRKNLDAVLSKEEANDDTNRVWTNIGDRLVEVDENGQEIRQADLDNSSVILQRAIRIDPQNQRARFLLASIYQRTGNYAAAESELQDAIQRNPSNPLPRLRLGVLLKQQGRYADALREFHAVERLRPRNPIMLYYTGMTFKDMGRCGRAVHYLQRFLTDMRANRFPKKREQAIQTVEECGGGRRGHSQRVMFR